MGLYISLVLKQTEQTTKQSLKISNGSKLSDSPATTYLSLNVLKLYFRW